MLKYTEGDVTIKGVKIHYYRTGGNKPPFLMLHGATDNGLCWGPLAENFVARYDIIMPDAQGHGKSDRLDPNFTFDSHTHQAAGLIEALGLRKPLVMGHSMGAGTTTNLAVAYPDLPGAIILEDPAWLQQDAMNPRNHEDIKKYMLSLKKKTLEELKAEGRASNPKWDEAEIGPWAESKIQVDATLFDARLINPTTYKELVPKIKCPALLVIAESGLVAQATAEDAARLWKSPQPFRWALIKHAGHSIHRENMTGFLAAFYSFLKEIKA
jgi:N-formylmaleamate deformylase